MENHAFQDLAATFIIAPDPRGRLKVKRDMELIREILTTIEAKEDLERRVITIAAKDELVVGHHIEMLHRVGMIDGVAVPSHDCPYAPILVKDLSWDGHDFLAALKNETVWGQMKQKLTAAELASLPLSLIKDVGVGLLKAYITQKVGLSG